MPDSISLKGPTQMIAQLLTSLAFLTGGAAGSPARCHEKNLGVTLDKGV